MVLAPPSNQLAKRARSLMKTVRLDFFTRLLHIHRKRVTLSREPLSPPFLAPPLLASGSPAELQCNPVTKI